MDFFNGCYRTLRNRLNTKSTTRDLVWIALFCEIWSLVPCLYTKYYGICVPPCQVCSLNKALFDAWKGLDDEFGETIFA